MKCFSVRCFTRFVAVVEQELASLSACRTTFGFQFHVQQDQGVDRYGIFLRGKVSGKNPVGLLLAVPATEAG